MLPPSLPEGRKFPNHRDFTSTNTMKGLDLRNLLILGLLGILVWQHLDAPVQGTAWAQEGPSDAADGFIAVTGRYGSGASALYVFDTRSRHLAVYRTDHGRSLELVAARDCRFDFLLESYNDSSPAPVKPGALRRGWQELNEKGGVDVSPEGERRSLKKMLEEEEDEDPSGNDGGGGGKDG